MSLVLELSPAVLERLRADADKAGLTVEELAAVRVAAPYNVGNGTGEPGSYYITEQEFRAGARDAAHAQEILNGPRRPLHESFAAMRVKYDISDFTPMSEEERSRLFDEAIGKLPLDKIAEAEWRGLL